MEQTPEQVNFETTLEALKQYVLKIKGTTDKNTVAMDLIESHLRSAVELYQYCDDLRKSLIDMKCYCKDLEAEVDELKLGKIKEDWRSNQKNVTWTNK